MPDFTESLIGIGPICDKGFKVTFSAEDVIVQDTQKRVVLSGWRNPKEPPALWHFNLLPSPADVPQPTATAPRLEASLAAFSAYDLPSVGALVRYLHAAAGFPVRDTWLRAIKAGNYATWPGLTYNNAAKYCPDAVETIMGHQVQVRQGTRSTQPKPPKPPNAKTSSSMPIQEPEEPSRELFVEVRHISRLYTDDTGRFPTRSRSGNQYVMIAYHYDANVILACPFKNRKDRHRLDAYAAIMESLKRRGHNVDLQILDNEASAAYKKEITETWGSKFQLVPPNMHRRNAAERAIRTFKAHFLSVLAGVADDFPRFLWDLLIPQAVMQLNFLRQATLNPSISAWEYFNGPFDYDATPFGPLGQKVIAHNKPGTRNTWDFRGEEGWSIGACMDGYRAQRYVAASTKCERTTDTISFRHQHLTVPTVTPEDRLQHGIVQLTSALRNAPAVRNDTQLEAIERLRNAFRRWAPPPSTSQSPPVPTPSPTPLPSLPRRRTRSQHRQLPLPPAAPAPSPRVVPPLSPSPPQAAPTPRVVLPPAEDSPAPVARVPGRPALEKPISRRVTRSMTQPIAARTRARQPKVGLRATFLRAFAFLAATAVATATCHTTRQRRRPPPPSWGTAPPPRPPAMQIPSVSPALAAKRKYLNALILHLAYPVTDEETGKPLEYRHLKRHPKLAPTWLRSYCNEMGRLCQGIGDGTKGPRSQRVAGTDTFRVMDYNDIPRDRRKGIADVKVVCEVRPQKADPNRVRITVAGYNIAFPGDVGTPTASLDLVKLMVNSVLSRPGAKFVCLDAANFYLQTPEMERKEYVRIKFSNIPDEFRREYGLTSDSPLVNQGWVYFAVVRGAYGLPQSGRLANDLLRKRLNAAGYHETATTPGLWRHVWRPVQFVLIVDDFGVEYVGRKHADHLLGVLNQHYEMSEDWEGKKFAGIDLSWNYASRHGDRTCRLSMDEYIRDLLFREGHKAPAKPQLSPHRHREIIYGAKQQHAPTEDTSSSLNEAGIKRVQRIVGALLYYARAVDNKILVALSAIGSQQASATENTAAAVNQLLDYVATYPADGLVFRSSGMELAAHADAGFNNESRARSRAGAHVYLSEGDARPRWNGAVVVIAAIMKNVMSSAAEAELGALYECAKAMVPLRQALIEMGWPQGKSPIQTDNSTADGVINNTIVPKRLKSMDLRLHWLRCREAQGQFRVFWAPGTENWADYYTKHFAAIHHESQRPIFAGIHTGG